MSGLYGLLFTKLALPSPSTIQGKTILITGANTGLGKEAARHALSLGAGTIIMGVRTQSKGKEAKADIEASTCSTKNKVLGSQTCGDGRGRLDIAIMNAGIASVEYAVTRDGWERGIQVNVLSTALLSLQLLPLLLQTKERDPSAQPHLAILTSDIHKSIKFPERYAEHILSVLNKEQQWKKSQATGGSTERYGVTKLMDIFITMELAKLVPRDAYGEPLEKAPWILKLVQALVARTVEEGSKTLLHAVAQGSETHGKWLENQVITDPGNIVTELEAAVVRGKIWAEIIAVLRNIDPEVRTEY
ncbi:Short-chain dehydrogenase/reductase SDR [Penicillium expansum]|nr:Short-chain dehydrogenase/reductase SDR [Penicillium expansum]